MTLQDHVRVGLEQVDSALFIDQFGNDVERVAESRRSGRSDRVHFGCHNMCDAAPDELFRCSPGSRTVLPCQAIGGYLHNYTLIDKALQTFWPALKLDISFRVGQNRHEPLRKESPDNVLDVCRGPVERRFYQQKPGPVKGDRAFSVDEVEQ